MTFCWLLPDTDQTGEIKVVRGGISTTLSESLGIALQDLPASFVLGIPESILRANSDEHFIYAQYAKLATKHLFSCSMRAGKDVGGRTVLLTYVQAMPELNSICIQVEPESQDVDSMMIHAMNTMSDLFRSESVQAGSNIARMLAEVNRTKASTFASECAPDATNKPDWTPEKKNISLTVKMLLMPLILLLLVVLLSWRV